MPSKVLGNDNICDNASVARETINTDAGIDKLKHRFVAVYFNFSNYFSDELKSFCKQDTANK